MVWCTSSLKRACAVDCWVSKPHSLILSQGNKRKTTTSHLNLLSQGQQPQNTTTVTLKYFTAGQALTIDGNQSLTRFTNAVVAAHFHDERSAGAKVSLRVFHVKIG